MFSSEISWEFMRDLGLVVFAVGSALVAFGFSFSRILLRELGPPAFRVKNVARVDLGQKHPCAGAVGLLANEALRGGLRCRLVKS